MTVCDGPWGCPQSLIKHALHPNLDVLDGNLFIAPYNSGGWSKARCPWSPSCRHQSPQSHLHGRRHSARSVMRICLSAVAKMPWHVPSGLPTIHVVALQRASKLPTAGFRAHATHLLSAFAVRCTAETLPLIPCHYYVHSSSARLITFLWMAWAGRCQACCFSDSSAGYLYHRQAMNG